MMEPQCTNLDTPVQYLRGIGPKRAGALKEIGITTIDDLLSYYPFGYFDRSTILKISELPKYLDSEQKVTVIGDVVQSDVRWSRRTRKAIFFLTVSDGSGFLTCLWFEGAEYRRKAFKTGETLALSSTPSLDSYQRLTFVHPEIDRLTKGEDDEPDWGKLFNTGAIIPKYSSSRELESVHLDSRGFRRAIRTALDAFGQYIEDILPFETLRSRGLISKREAIKSIHFPATMDDQKKARTHLVYEEFFFQQLLHAIRQNERKKEPKGISYTVQSARAKKLVDSLPFKLTNAQLRVIREMNDDMRAPFPMNRMLQGDVGSGKTIVALIAMLVATDNGYQSVLMAPTEILAEQHARTIQQWTQGLDLQMRLLVGAQKKKERNETLNKLKDGSINIIVGTHALLEEDVEFHSLGLVVIDEQHRFGVMQRATLRKKGLHPDVLVMTATPIPRTLMLTTYGDLDVSIIDELPPHRQQIVTAIRKESEKEKVYEFARDELRRGRQVYVVFPLVEESEKLDLKDAVSEYERLKAGVFAGFSVGLLHGRMKGEEKDELMKRYKENSINALISTTVIEVGIDVPNATIMIVENAERFGLAQLHQLRGRVGRGSDKSYCILIANFDWYDLHKKKLTGGEITKEKDAARKRLQTMAETNDGFKIAEVDLELRGPGELFGARQSGYRMFKLADPIIDSDVLSVARDDAFTLVHDDTLMNKPEHRLLGRYVESRLKPLLQLSEIG